MRLWLWYAPGNEAQIMEACSAAYVELERRGVGPEDAYQASLEAAELSEEHTDEITVHADGVVAWYAAEHVALEKLFALTGEWPQQAALILTSGKGAA